MASVIATLVGERWLDEVMLQAGESNVGADTITVITLPPSLGDVAIMEISATDQAIATMVANPEVLGLRAVIMSSSIVRDIVGVSNWWKVSAVRLATYISPDPLVLWRQAETLVLEYPELDTNATPTDDITFSIKCVRVRPQVVSEQPQPLRLVR